MITLTACALARFKELVDDGEGVRIYLAAGGCNPSVALEIVSGPEEGDMMHVQDNFVFYLEKEASRVLPEVTIDYAERMGFMISGMPKLPCCG